MSLDFTKLTDAVAKVASLAASHADVSSQVVAANAARDAALADLAQAQIDIDDMAAKLIASATTPAEATGLAAVAAALVAPVSPVVAPVAPAVDPTAPVVVAPAPAVAVVAPAPTGTPVAPAVAAVTSPATTFLPGDPRANA